MHKRRALPSQLFAFATVKAERRMIGRKDLKRAVLETAPNRLLASYIARRRATDMLRSFKSVEIKIIRRQEQILGAGTLPGSARAILG